MLKAFITGLGGGELTANEATFLAAERPCGAILFSRNCQSHGQIRRLVTDVRSAVGSDDILILIDQEGGRVQRLRPPLGRALPAGAAYDAMYGRDRLRALRAAHGVARLVATDLAALGINTDCWPVLDLPVPGSHDIIGDRALGRAPTQVWELGDAICRGLVHGGILPVIKHIPGHGRAQADSHLALPVVTASRDELARTDFAAFRGAVTACGEGYAMAAMTAHVVYTTIDAERPASTSARVHADVIRGEIGFDGLLMSDDLSMKALTGSLGERAQAVFDAGTDVALHCNGDLAEMKAVAAASPFLSGRALARFRRPFEQGQFDQPPPSMAVESEECLAELMGIDRQRSESV